MQAKGWDVFCSVTLTEISMSVFDSLPDSVSVSIRLIRKISIDSLITNFEFIFRGVHA